MEDTCHTQCCKNPIGFVRSNCESLTSLVDNLDAILAAAGEGPAAGLSCIQTIACINDAISNGQIVKNDQNINAVSGSFNSLSGILTVNLSDGNNFNISGWCVDSQPVEINPGGSFPSDTQLTAASNSNCPGTVLFYQGTAKNPIYAWVTSAGGTFSLVRGPLSPVAQPFQLTGSAQSATTATPLPGNVNAYRTGTVLIGGSDSGLIHSTGTLGTGSDRPRFEVIGTIATGQGNHVVTGSNSGVIGGNVNIASGLNSVVAGGVGNEATASNSFSAGGQSNKANFQDSAIIGGVSNTTSGFRSAIIGGWECINSGQQSLVSGQLNENSGHSALVVGFTNINTAGHASLVFGSLNTNAGEASIIGGSGNNVDSNADSSCLVGNTNTWGFSRSIGAGDNNNVSGFGSIVSGLANIGNIQRGIVCGQSNNVTQVDGLVVGSGNTVTTSPRSIVGGISNTADLSSSSIVSGSGNTSRANQSLISGTNNVVGIAVPIVGSSNLLISGSGIVVDDAITNSVALGAAPQLLHSNSFIFSAASANTTPTVASSSFTSHSDGGARFLTNSAGTVGAELIPGATTWSAISLRDKKVNIIQLTDALSKVNSLGIYSYSYKDDEGNPTKLKKLDENDWVDTDRDLIQLGPMADGDDGWSEIVGTGSDDKVSSHDMAALALAAIKELIQKNDELEYRIAKLEEK